MLIVDDHAEFRTSACALLEADGFVVVGEAAHGAEAIEGSEPKLAFDRDSVWISTPAESTVARIDPVRGTIRKRTLLGATGVCWFLGNFSTDLLYLHRGPLVHLVVAFAGWRARSRLDPKSRRVLARIKLRQQPVAVATGGGVVAVATLASPL